MMIHWTDMATATTATAIISRRVVIVGSRMAQSPEHPLSRLEAVNRLWT